MKRDGDEMIAGITGTSRPYHCTQSANGSPAPWRPSDIAWLSSEPPDDTNAVIIVYLSGIPPLPPDAVTTTQLLSVMRIIPSFGKSVDLAQRVNRSIVIPITNSSEITVSRIASRLEQSINNRLGKRATVRAACGVSVICSTDTKLLEPATRALLAAIQRL